jgi:hypothetical protein
MSGTMVQPDNSGSGMSAHGDAYLTCLAWPSLTGHADIAERPASVRHIGEYTRRSSRENFAEADEGDTS